MSTDTSASPSKGSLRSRFGAAVRRSSIGLIRPSASRSGSISESDDSSSLKGRRRSGSSSFEPSAIQTSHLKTVVTPSPIIESPVTKLPSLADKAMVASTTEVNKSSDSSRDPAYDAQQQTPVVASRSESEASPKVEETRKEEEPSKVGEETSKEEEAPKAEEEAPKVEETPAAPVAAEVEAEKSDEVKTEEDTAHHAMESSGSSEAHDYGTQVEEPSLVLGGGYHGPGAFIDSPTALSDAALSDPHVDVQSIASRLPEHGYEVDEPTVGAQEAASLSTSPPAPVVTAAQDAPGAFNDDEDNKLPSASHTSAHHIPTPDSGIAILPAIERTHSTEKHAEQPQQTYDTMTDPAPSYFTTMPEPIQASDSTHTAVPRQFAQNLEENVWGYSAAPATGTTAESTTPRGGAYAASGRVVVVNAMPNGTGKKMDDDRISMFSFGDGAAHGPEVVEGEFKRSDLNDPFSDHAYPSTLIDMPHPVDPVVSMPIPNEGARSIHTMPSVQNLHVTNQAPGEHQPLLHRTGTVTSYTDPSTTLQATNSATSVQLFTKHGWTEYALPDGTTYFAHPILRVITDINLHSTIKFHAVTEYLDTANNSNFAAPGLSGHPLDSREVWLREGDSTALRNVKPTLVMNWVDHAKRLVSLKGADIAEEEEGEERLDMEYRYWSYMESHPAHLTLSPVAKNQAMEALAWSYTDSLLPLAATPKPIPPPFSQEECQHLMGLLRSFGEPGPGIQNAIQTRIIAKILVRVGKWKQAHFRPTKPLPSDVTTPRPALPSAHVRAGGKFHLRRALADVFVTCFCFGIPYLYMERDRRMMSGVSLADLEARVGGGGGMGGMSRFRNIAAGPVLLVGACTCLVASTILSASVTFLSYTGLDTLSGIATLVAVVFSIGSLVSSVVAFVRYKSDMEHALLTTAVGEGMMFEYRRGITLSLPVVFLTYSIIGFVVALLLFTLKDTQGTNPHLPSPHMIFRAVVDHAWWATLGVLGGVAVVLGLSWMCSPRRYY